MPGHPDPVSAGSRGAPAPRSALRRVGKVEDALRVAASPDRRMPAGGQPLRGGTDHREQEGRRFLRIRAKFQRGARPFPGSEMQESRCLRQPPGQGGHAPPRERPARRRPAGEVGELVPESHGFLVKFSFDCRYRLETRGQGFRDPGGQLLRPGQEVHPGPVPHRARVHEIQPRQVRKKKEPALFFHDFSNLKATRGIRDSVMFIILF